MPLFTYGLSFVNRRQKIDVVEEKAKNWAKIANIFNCREIGSISKIDFSSNLKSRKQ